MGVVYNAAIPQMALQNTSSVMISSMAASEDSPMSRMMRARYKDTGKLVYKTRIFSTICSRCRLRGRTDCKHAVEMPWSSQSQSAKIAALMADQSEIYKREILNEGSASNMSKAFDPEAVEAFSASNYYIPPTQTIKHVFLAVDPAAGGSGSQFAMVSHVVVPRADRGNNEDGSGSVSEDVVVVAADNSEGLPADPASYYDLLVSHIKMLQAHPLFRKARVIVIPENNFAFEALNIESELRASFSPQDVVCFRSELAKAGVRTDNLLKRAFADGLGRALTRRAIHFWSDFMSFKAQQRNARSRAQVGLAEDDVRDELTRQMQNFLKVTKPARDPTKPPVVQYTGKLYGGYDDMLIALMLANTCRRAFYDHEDYHAPA